LDRTLFRGEKVVQAAYFCYLCQKLSLFFVIYVKKTTNQSDYATGNREYPFDLPAVRGIQEFEFTHDVTFFVGENGSGKSTLIKAIASAD
jgi:ABC-type polysaccharide/polyol phosphate transport system ATPase subunit